MTKSFLKFAPIFAVIAIRLAIAPVSHAQNQGSVTHITPVPDGAYFNVDGQSYNHAAAAVWPTRSKHTSYVDSPVQNPGASKTRLSFQGWEFAGQPLQGNPVVVTADPSIGEYQAIFTVQYALSIVFFNCPDPASCASPGTILVDGAPINSTTEIYVSAGGQSKLQAIPNPGWVFVGWQPVPGQVITGFQDIVTVNGPTAAYPKFQVARRVDLATVPPGLLVLADRIQV